MTHVPHGSLDPKSREEIAKIEIGQTDISPALARLLVAVFLGMCCLVPLFELVRAAGGDERARRPWALLFGLPAETSAAARSLYVEPSAGIRASAWAATIAANRVVLEGLHTFEKALEDESRLASSLRPPAQTLLTGALGAGNEQVYVGREGWLFYRRDTEYVTGPGFLSAAVQQRRIDAAAEWTERPQPDPVRTILRFHAKLDALGIVLILMPVPVKPTVHPEMLAGRMPAAPAHNRDYQPFLEALARGGVRVFDVADLLVQEARLTGVSQYLATDTHWRPEAMERTADALAARVRDAVSLPAVPDPGYRPAAVAHASHGDIFRMLDLPDHQTLYTPEAVTLRRITTGGGAPWASSPAADVLVLGDSFANIYSGESMGWGTGSGLVEQLSYALRRPVDRLIQNDAGAHATRQMLDRAGPARLAGKRVVIWQFAARELAFGDWKEE